MNAIVLTHVYATAKNGKTYYVCTYNQNGRRAIKYAPAMYQSEPEVRAWFEKEFTATKEEEKTPQVQPTAKTIAGLADWWFEYRKEDPELHNRKGYINNWVLGKGRSLKHPDLPATSHPIADMPLEIRHNPFNDPEITRENDEKFSLCRTWIRSINRAPATVRNIVQTLRTMIDDARAENKISRTNSINYFSDKVVLSAINKGKPVERLIGEENTIALQHSNVLTILACNTIPSERQVRYWIAFATGLRDSEIAGLQWQDINFGNNTITVDRQLKRGSKGTHITAEFKPPKKGSYRTIPLHPSAAAVLTLWKNTGWLVYTGRKPNDYDAVLPNQQGLFYHPHSSTFLQKDLKRANISATFRGVGGKSAPFDFHATRRTFASMCEQAGIDGARVSALLGHKAKGVTAKHYLERNLEACREAIGKIQLLSC